MIDTMNVVPFSISSNLSAVFTVSIIVGLTVAPINVGLLYITEPLKTVFQVLVVETNPEIRETMRGGSIP
jgi:hypothetical protein